jgi:prepilin-type N-terminal cleavage/methylation domain-containing protein
LIMRITGINKNKLIRIDGFTLIELLVTITIIGILGAIVTMAYSGITQKATAAALQSDLSNASKLLKMYYTEYGYYPTTLDTNNCPATPTIDSKYCLKPSSGNTFVYSSIISQIFHLTNTKGNTSYSITNNTSPAIATTAPGSTTGSACPTGFIPVPGSGTYGTNDFCAMKYEAKADDNGDGTGDTNQTTGSNTWPADTYPISNTRKLVSTAAGYPVANISQTTATTAASSYTANCDTGCHLMTEAEWMTIAQNVLSVASNWSGGSVGSGYIYSGHNDSSPNNALVDTSNGSDPYNGTGDAAPSNQRRTLTLNNNEVIWDLSGDVLEWTQDSIGSGQQPGLSGESTYDSKEWNNNSLLMNGLLSSSRPDSIGIPGITWNSSSGVGQLYSNYGETVQRGFLRGGRWLSGGIAGVLSLHLNLSPSFVGTNAGLRVAK